MINHHDLHELESRLQALLQQEITSVVELEAWLAAERVIRDEVEEAVVRHRIDFFCDTANAVKRDLYSYDQSTVLPLWTTYEAKFDRKFCECLFTTQLDEKQYGLTRKIRRSKVELFREENIPLTIREGELITSYREIMGSLTVDWEGETKPYPFAKAQEDHADRSVRERAWRAMAEARKGVKSRIDDLMTELVNVRHAMAQNAGFENYRDYLFQVKNREYSIQDCYDFHASVQQYVIPAWDRLAAVFQKELGADTYRPWDIGFCTLRRAPFETVTELMDGVEEMLGKTDPYFQERFRYMRENGLLDIESRSGKIQGAYCDYFPESREAVVLSNFSPSFVALIALIHELGHAFHGYLQYASHGIMQEHNQREEICELFSHSLELLLLDKLDTFYTDPHPYKNAQREEMHRAFNMLINPIKGDLFQHWLYTNPQHTSEERAAKYLEIEKTYMYHPVDITDLEAELGTHWMNSAHFFAYPFYQMEYAMSELGALQLLQIYREDPARATALYKQGASASSSLTIAEIYQQAGVAFDFSPSSIEKTAHFVEQVIQELQ